MTLKQQKKGRRFVSRRMLMLLLLTLSIPVAIWSFDVVYELLPKPPKALADYWATNAQHKSHTVTYNYSKLFSLFRKIERIRKATRQSSNPIALDRMRQVRDRLLREKNKFERYFYAVRDSYGANQLPGDLKRRLYYLRDVVKRKLKTINQLISKAERQAQQETSEPIELSITLSFS